MSQYIQLSDGSHAAQTSLTGRNVALAGKKSVATAGVPVSLGNTKVGDGVYLVANPANTGNVYVFPVDFDKSSLPEMVTNGDFSIGNTGNANFSGWDNNVTYPYETFSATGGTLHAVNISTDFGIMNTTQTLSVTAGRSYTITFDFTLNSGLAPKVNIANNVTVRQTLANEGTLTSGKKTFTLVPTITESVKLEFFTNTGNASDFILDNVSMKENNGKVFVVPLRPGDSDFWNVGNISALMVDSDVNGDSVFWKGAV